MWVLCGCECGWVCLCVVCVCGVVLCGSVLFVVCLWCVCVPCVAGIDTTARASAPAFGICTSLDLLL